MEEDLLRRAADLAERCERTATVTSTAFLTPAEQYALTNWARHRDCTLVLHGGGEGCERRAAFFLPFYLTAEDFDPAEHLRAVHFSAPFGAPGHRDYLGAILGLGIRREWVGDILVQDHGAYVFCLPSVEPELRTLGAEASFMTGSGSVCCGLFPSFAQAKRACAQLEKCGRAFVLSTKSRSLEVISVRI